MRCPTLKDLPPLPRGKTSWPWTEESPQLEAIRSILLQGYHNLGYILKSLVFGYSVMYDNQYYP
jgi:hypothetical protein